MSDRILLQLIGRIYDAAVDARLWRQFLIEFSAAVNVVGTGLYVQDLKSHDANVYEFTGFDPAYLREYEQHYAPRNVFINYGKSKMTEGHVFTGAELCSKADVLRSEYYNDCLRRYDLFFPIGAVTLQERSAASLITSWRPESLGDFDRRDVALTFNQGVVTGNVTVQNGGTLILSNGSKIGGSIQGNGGTVAISNSAVGGSVKVTGGTISMTNGTIGGDVQLTNITIPKGLTPSVVNTVITGNVQVTGPSSGKAGSAVNFIGDTVGGNLQVTSVYAEAYFIIEDTIVRGDLQVQTSGGGIIIVRNWIYGNLRANNNALATAYLTIGGPDPLQGDTLQGNIVTGDVQINNNEGSVIVEDNTIRSNLECSGNTDGVYGSGDQAASTQGQCAGF